MICLVSLDTGGPNISPQLAINHEIDFIHHKYAPKKKCYLGKGPAKNPFKFFSKICYTYLMGYKKSLTEFLINITYFLTASVQILTDFVSCLYIGTLT